MTAFNKSEFLFSIKFILKPPSNLIIEDNRME